MVFEMKHITKTYDSVVANDEKHLILAVRVPEAAKPKNMEVGLPPQEDAWLFFAAVFDAETGMTGFSLNFDPFIRQQLQGKQLFSEGQSPRLLLGRDVLAALPLEDVASQGYCFQVDLTLRAVEAGYVIVEVPITFSDREFGDSKMSGDIVREALLRVTRWGVRRRAAQLYELFNPQR